MFHLLNDSVHLFSAGHDADKISSGEIIEGLDNPKLDEILGDMAANSATKSNWCAAHPMNSTWMLISRAN